MSDIELVSKISRHPFRKVLVTGARGFVGRRLTAKLVGAGPSDCIVAVGGRSSEAIDDGVDFLPLNVEDADSVSRAVKDFRPDLVVHLAAQSSVGAAVGAAYRTWSVNTIGSIALAQAVATYSPEATVLFPSSGEVYGRAFNAGTAFETTLPQPVSPYSKSKLAAEQAFDDILPRSARLIVARPSNHSGANQDTRFVLPSFAEQILSGGGNVHVGNLSSSRDFLHVDDVVDAYMALISHADEMDNRNLFNISSQVTWSISDLLSRMIQLAGVEVSILPDPHRMRTNEVPAARIDSHMIRNATQWAPTRSIDDVLQDVLEGVRARLVEKAETP